MQNNVLQKKKQQLGITRCQFLNFSFLKGNKNSEPKLAMKHPLRKFSDKC